MNIPRYLCAISAMALVFAGGCESEKDDDSGLSISPLTCKLKIRETKVFTASGGENYRWSVKDPSLGTLSSTAGSTVTYIASSQAGDQVLTLNGVNIYGEEKAPANATIEQVIPDEDNDKSNSSQDSSQNSSQDSSQNSSQDSSQSSSQNSSQSSSQDNSQNSSQNSSQSSSQTNSLNSAQQ